MKLMRKHHTVRETVQMTLLLMREQVHHIKLSPAAWILLGGLSILPALYAWVNIAANWDPYGNTGNLQVAVVNQDAGTEVDAVKMNIGDDIVENLKGNTSIGWQFVDYDVAMERLETGEYYAVLVIPENFSEDMTSFTRADVKKATIQYYNNEKRNAISTKILNTGMGTVQNTITQSFIETLTNEVLKVLKEGDSVYANYQPVLTRMLDTMDLTAANMDLFITNMNDFQTMLEEADNLSESAENVLPGASKALRNASELTLNAQTTLQDAKTTLNNIDRLIANSVTSINLLGEQIHTTADTLSNTTDDDIDSVRAKLQYLSDETEAIGDSLRRLAKTLDRFNRLLPVPTQTIDAFVKELESAAITMDNSAATFRDLRTRLGDGILNLDDVKQQTLATTDTVTKTVNDIWNDYNSNVSGSVDTTLDSLSNTLDDTYKLLDSTSSLIPQVDGLLGTLRGMKPAGMGTIDRFRETLKESQDILTQATGDIRELTDDEKYQRVLEFIRQDVDKESEFLANPIIMESHRVNPVMNYGSGMSPFYSTLGIWVGAILIMSMVSVINEKGLESYPEAGWTAMYLSRFSLYSMLSLAQSIIIALGDLFILGVECAHPILFVLLCICIGQVFVLFAYSLAFTFADIGKAMAIVTLVLQIAASGGTFPIQMTPSFFQHVNPFLPFTYCIGAMREICFGIYWPTLIKNLCGMAAVPILSLTIVIIFGPALRRFTLAFERSMKRSGLM